MSAKRGNKKHMAPLSQDFFALGGKLINGVL